MTAVEGPIIFLDVDGVLHPLNEKHFPVGADVEDLVERADEDGKDTEDMGVSRVCTGEFHRQCMENLKDAVTKTGASIVLSSTWRESGRGRRAVDAVLASYGIAPHVGCTPSLGYAAGRDREVRAWLETKGQNVGTKWVAIDDMDLSQGLGENFVHINAKVGLSEEDVERMVKILS
jgi:hypothetical protein